MSLSQVLHGHVSQMREPACGHLVITIDEINILPDFFFYSLSVQLYNTVQQSVAAICLHFHISLFYDSQHFAENKY